MESVVQNYTAIYMPGFGFSLGVQVVIARRNGEGRYQDAGKVFYQGLIFLSLFAIVIFILSKLYSPALLRMMISSDNVYQATVKYIKWRDYSYLFTFPLLVIRAFFILSRSHPIPLAIYWTAEQLYVTVLLILSLLYLKSNRWKRDEFPDL